jgi:CheY-like chemotaxis protein
MAKRALERYGYTVLVADGGLAAINILKRHPGKIDLALLDLSMPGMSGEETLPEEDQAGGEGIRIERLQRVRGDDGVQGPTGSRLYPEAKSPTHPQHLPRR